MEQHILDFIRQTFDAIGWSGVVLLMAIESACIPLPSELIMPLSGWMLIAGKGLGWQFVLLAGFFGAVGNVAGSWVAYTVGARGGRPFIERYGKYILLSKRDLDLADRWFLKYGDATAFFSRLLPAVRTFISLPAGIAKMNLWRFLLYTFLGALPWSTGLAWAGYALGNNWEQVRQVMRPFDIPIILSIVGTAGFFIWHRLKQQAGSS